MSGCQYDTDGDGNCPYHPKGCPPTGLLDVTADTLQMGDVLDEGVEVRSLTVACDGWIHIETTQGWITRPPNLTIRVLRQSPFRMGIVPDSPPGTTVTAGVSVGFGSHARIRGDMRFTPLSGA